MFYSIAEGRSKDAIGIKRKNNDHGKFGHHCN